MNIEPLTSFETTLLKSLIYDSEFFGKVMPILKEKYFSNPAHRKIFEIIKNYYKEFQAIPDIVEVAIKIKNIPNSELRSEAAKALKEVDSTKLLDNKDFLIQEAVNWVKDALYLEALQIGSDGLMKKDDSLKLKAQQILEERAKITIDSDLGLDFHDIDEMIRYYTELKIGIKTRHPQINRRLGPGFLPGTLSIVLAAAGVGKTLFLCDLISGMIQNNKNVLLVSLEMSDKEIMKRIHANVLNLPVYALTDLSKTEEERRQIKENDPTYEIITKDDIIEAYNKVVLSGNCGKFFVKDYPAGYFTPLMLEQLVRSYKLEKNIDFDIIFIDYLGIMKSDLVPPSVGLYSYIKSIGEELRAVAKKLQKPIISASQLNREAYRNVDNADNANISDSIGTAMTADFMLFLLQDQEMKQKCEILCKITKNRFTGITDSWKMDVDYKYMRFVEKVVDEVPPVIDRIENIQKNSKLDEFGLFDDDLTAQIDINTKPNISSKDSLSEEIEKITRDQTNLDDIAKNEIRKIINQDINKIEKENKDIDFDEILKSLDI